MHGSPYTDQSGTTESMPPTLHQLPLQRLFFFQHINLPCHAAKNKICKIHSGGLPTQWKLRASISMKNLFAEGETLGGLSRDVGGGEEKQNGFKEHSKSV